MKFDTGEPCMSVLVEEWPKERAADKKTEIHFDAQLKLN